MSPSAPLGNPSRLRIAGWVRGMLALLLACGIPQLRAQSPSLPPGPERAKVTDACTECHDARIVMQQRLSQAAWGKEVDKMIKWGALVEAADREAFIGYLSTNFPADKAAEPEPRVAAAGKR
jgi:hypothetical protein